MRALFFIIILFLANYAFSSSPLGRLGRATNQNSGQFTIETNDEENYQLQVYNLLGVLVYEKQVTNQERINLEQLSSSTYIAKIILGGDVVKTTRICIMK